LPGAVFFGLEIKEFKKRLIRAFRGVDMKKRFENRSLLFTVLQVFQVTVRTGRIRATVHTDRIISRSALC
jgi:hypothetical protein